MKGNTVRRFTPIEIVYHWSQAIPYAVLFCTGGVMLFQRLFDVGLIAHETLSKIHRVSGFVLIFILIQTLTASFISISFRELRQKIGKSLSWGLKDLIWLAKVEAKAVLPPADSPGKKLQILRLAKILPSLIIYSEVPIAYFTIITLVPAVIVSGLLMIFVPGALGFWIIHILLFIPACILLGLHIFRTLLYQRSRRLLITVIITFVIIVISVSAVLAYRPKQIKNHTVNIFDKYGVGAIVPGPLYLGHANDPNLRDCTSCHQFFSSPSSDKCLSCHKAIAERMTAKSGYHGSLKGQCIECHSDHKGEDVTIVSFDQTTFDHSVADFKLDGSHNDLACNKCHNKKKKGVESVRYIGLEFGKCISCHDSTERYMRGITAKATYKPDPHFGRTSCIECHQTDISRQTPIAYATKCKQCHNAYYEDLFYDWSKSLSLINMQAESLLNSAQIKNDPDIDQLAERIEEIQTIGFHNIQLAHELWNEFVQERQ